MPTKADKNRKIRKPILIGIGVIILLLWILAIVISSIYYSRFIYEDEYAIVIDGGSSGTRMYTYSWPGGLSASKGDHVPIKQYLYCVMNDKGVDKFTSRNDVVLSFNDCMQQASKKIPASRKSRTHISLAATAGMRVLNISDPDRASRILGYIRDYFNASEFLYTNPNQVEIIQGTDEGLYAWISTNYFLNKFTPNAKPDDTVGILDLGGASTQIVFQPKKYSPSSSVASNFMSPRICGVDYTPYAHSYLCWGQNQIYLIFRAYLIMKNGYSTNVTSPCLTAGAASVLSGASIKSSPCISGFNFPSPLVFNSSNILANSNYTIYGSSDPQGCRADMNVLFPDLTCQNPPCSFNGVYLPPIYNVTFYGFAYFYDQITNTEILTKSSLKKDMRAYKNTTSYLCSLPFSQLIAANQQTGNQISQSGLEILCFANNYAISLLGKYGITSFDNVNIKFDIDGNTVTWALGYLFHQINRDDFLPYEAPPRKLASEFFIPAISIASVFTVLTIIAIFVCIFWG